MAAKYKRRDSRFKMQVALEAAKDEKQIKEIAREFGIHPKQVGDWRDRLLASSHQIFAMKSPKKALQEHENEELKKLIGKQALEIEWLKKKLPK